jgi:hypothetical protein
VVDDSVLLLFELEWRAHADEKDDDDNKPVWPTWAVGALFRGARCVHISRVCFHISIPSFTSRDILVKGRTHPVVCRQIPEGVKEHHVLVEGRMYS